MMREAHSLFGETSRILPVLRTSLKQARPPRTLADLPLRGSGVLRAIDLPEALAQRLMEMGLVPGSTVSAPFAAPGGDPRVYRVDGAEVALRREMAQFLTLETTEDPA